MKTMKTMAWIGLLAVVLAGAVAVRAGEEPKPKPYPLDTCAVCGMKLGSMGKPYVFVYKGQEVKVCDKSEEADFKKDPAKYLKPIEAAEAKDKK